MATKYPATTVNESLANLGGSAAFDGISAALIIPEDMHGHRAHEAPETVRVADAAGSGVWAGAGFGAAITALLVQLDARYAANSGGTPSVGTETTKTAMRAMVGAAAQDGFFTLFQDMETFHGHANSASGAHQAIALLVSNAMPAAVSAGTATTEAAVDLLAKLDARYQSHA